MPAQSRPELHVQLISPVLDRISSNASPPALHNASNKNDTICGFASTPSLSCMASTSSSACPIFFIRISCRPSLGKSSGKR